MGSNGEDRQFRQARMSTPSSSRALDARADRQDDATSSPDTPEPDSTTPLIRRQQDDAAPSRRRLSRLICYLALLFLIAALFFLINRSFRSNKPPAEGDEPASSLWPNATLTNGTHTFRRTVILISLDGAKPAYLDSGLAPHLQSLGTSSPSSRRASFMKPIFPTLTFPNHWALLTGLYASAHGVIANDFTLTSSGQQFYYTNPQRSWNASWWLGEPIWATVQRAGLSSAVLMWPGPPITSAGAKPTYFQKYSSAPEWNLDGRLRQVLKWIDMADINSRPSLICAYVPDIDQAAHKFGPESKQAMAAVKDVDATIGRLRKELVQKRKLGDIVDVVVVSDHGMTTTSNHKLVFLDELLGPGLYAKVEHRDAWPLAGLRFKGESEAEREEYAQQAYEKLHGSEKGEGFDVFWREDLPARFHLSSHLVEDRLAPLWMIPKLGWSITTNHEMATFSDGIYGPIGNHGYDNEEPDMHAIFVASGPSFAKATSKALKSGKKRWNMAGFENIHVHNLVARILGVPATTRAPTNGTWSFWDAHLRHGL